jgi:hypothetical protein
MSVVTDQNLHKERRPAVVAIQEEYLRDAIAQRHAFVPAPQANDMPR